MNDQQRDRVLRTILVVVGLVFIFGTILAVFGLVFVFGVWPLMLL